jgi:hypothetical protein
MKRKKLKITVVIHRLDALRVPLVGNGASVGGLALSGSGPSGATTLSEACLDRAGRVNDGRVGGDNGRVGSHDGRVGDNWAANSGGGESVAVLDHGGGVLGLDGVATREFVEVDTFNTLVDNGVESAAVHVGLRVDSEGAARLGLATDIRARIHGPLERVILPAEDVVSVLSVTGGITVGEDEWLGAISGELAVELAGIPDDLEEEKGHASGVGGGAASNVEEETVTADGALGVSHVRRVVRGVEILSIPARGEEDVGTDSSGTLSGGEGDGVPASGTRVRVGTVTLEVRAEATEANGTSIDIVGSRGPPCTGHWVTSDHTETLLESSDLLITADGLDVIDGHTTVGVADELVGHLGYANETAVAGLEVEDGCPVVGVVLLELTSRASRELGEVVGGVHADVEGISSNDLMDVTRNLAWSHQRVETLGDETRATESEEGMGSRRNSRKREEGSPLHV